MALRPRVAFVLLLVAAVVANAALAPCDGWQASATARMACCAGPEHERSQARADDCCAAGEQRQHSETIAIALQALTPSLNAVLAFTKPLAVATSPVPFSREHRRRGSPPDTHLLLAVFLI